MKLSIIVATRNRAHELAPCLDSIAAAIARAAPAEVEIIMVDNGSTDNSREILEAWAKANSGQLRLISEPRPGKSRALNRAIAAARGDVLAITDDDCRLHPEYVNDLLRHYADEAEPVLRGGRVELGDPTDLPITIQTQPEKLRWHRSDPMRRAHLGGGVIPGCNMTMRRAVFERVGPFDERLGPGARIPAGEDIDYVYRAFLAGIVIEYVPDMTVIHKHGRKSKDAAIRLLKNYIVGTGALYAKFLFRHPNFRNKFSRSKTRPATTVTLPDNGGMYISRRATLLYAAWGALRYRFHV